MSLNDVELSRGVICLVTIFPPSLLIERYPCLPERRNLFVVAISIDVRFSPRLAELPSDQNTAYSRENPLQC